MLSYSIRKTASWQSWESRSSEESAVLVSTFIAQFCNSALVLVLVNIDWSKLLGFSLGNPSKTDGFGFDWYGTVGVPILLNLCINSVVTHVVKLAMKLKGRVDVWRKWQAMRTQKELNKLCRSSVAKFNLSER